MIKRSNATPFRSLHRVISEIISIPLGPLTGLLLISFAASGLLATLAEQGKATFTPTLPYVAISALAAWVVVAFLHAVHGWIFLRWTPEPLEGTRWKTPAGAVGLFKQKNYDGSLVLAFPSGVTAEYKRGTLIRED